MNHESKIIHEIFLHPGEFHLSTKPEKVMTVLGSCISVIMYDTNRQISMMSHNLMPSCGNPTTCNGNCPNVYKYIECSVKKMVKVYDSVNIKRNNIVVKLFGGAELMAGGRNFESLNSIGSRNIETAKKIIEEKELRLVAQDLGGETSRKIIFVTHTGEVYLRRTKPKFDIDK
jgi:chemotaxis protein CheD